MGDMWRSQKMQLVQMIVQNDAAHAIINKLGQVGLVDFRDLNAGTSFYKRSFVEEVRKCDELARILRVIAEEYEESPIEIGEKDDALSLKLSLEDVEPKIKELEEELDGLKSTQDVRLAPAHGLPPPVGFLAKPRSPLLSSARVGTTTTRRLVLISPLPCSLFPHPGSFS